MLIYYYSELELYSFTVIPPATTIEQVELSTEKCLKTAVLGLVYTKPRADFTTLRNKLLRCIYTHIYTYFVFWATGLLGAVARSWPAGLLTLPAGLPPSDLPNLLLSDIYLLTYLLRLNS